MRLVKRNFAFGVGMLLLGLASAHGQWNVVIWSVPGGAHFWSRNGVIYKVILPMVTLGTVPPFAFK